MTARIPNPHQSAALLPRGIWSTLREAIRGSAIDYTTAPVGQAVIMLAVPMVMEMAMESIFAVADVFWVAHLGADAVATVGLTESMLTMIYTAAMGLSIGATALVARRMGEQDPEGAARAAGQSIVLGLIVAALIAIIGAPAAPALLRVMGASPEVIATGSGFTRVMLGGNVTIVLLFLLNAVFRGSGDAAIAMRVLLLGNALNIMLGPCFIFGLGPFPELGVTGAGVATNIGRGTAVAFQLSVLLRGHGRLRLQARHLRLDLSIMKSVLRLSGSGTIQILIGTASYVGLVRILSVFGSAALAGYTIGIRIIIFALLPAFGISNAAATMVGQNLGAGRPDRAEEAVWTAARYNMLFLGAVGLIFGLAWPRGRLDRVIQQRREIMRVELYTINHLLAMNIRVGGGVIQAVQRIVERGRGAVVDELAEVLRAHRSGVRIGAALSRAAAQSPEPHAARTYRLLATGAEHGADLAKGLMDLSRDLRNQRREDLRRMATRNRAATIFPIVAILAPVLLVFVGAPLPSIIFGQLGGR
jgi:putative MATE family efflux protein